MHYPENLEQLKKLVMDARERGVGLVPLSSAAPHIHGASENDRAETVCFEKMNKILKIDRTNRYARVESGVSFGELIPKMAENGLRLNVPFLPRAGKSVVASALEREAVLLPKYQFDYTDPLLTAEAVFGTGDEFRTGSAAGPGPKELLKADMVAPWGPGTIDYLRFLIGAQGTMGLVSWATVKAEVLPTVSKLFFVEAESLSALTKLAAELLFRRIPDDCVILNRVNFAAAFTDGAEEESSLRADLAPWTLVCRVCGYERYPEERVEIYEKYLRECCAEQGLEPVSAPAGNMAFAQRVDSMLGDCDRRETYWKLRRGGVEEILFLAPPSKTPDLEELMECELSGWDSDALGITVHPQVQGRAFRVECDLFYESCGEKAKLWADKTRRSLFEAGAHFDRPYGTLPELVYPDEATETLTLRKLKAIFDPDGVLNPGKLCF